METLTVILVAITIVSAIFYFRRNENVYNFRIEVINKCYDVLGSFLDSLKNDKELNERHEELEQLKMKKDEILSKHSYFSMMFSLKQLKLERWYTKEEIEFMNLKFVSK